nr:chloride channel protein [Betaproteobacteria bacterium]
FVVLGGLAGIVGTALPTVFYWTRDRFHELPIPPHFKPAVGGLALGLIGLAAPALLGGGYGYIQLALQGGAGIAVWMLLMLSLGKIVALSLTIASGGSGGVFAPSLFVGALLGAAFAALLHAAGVTGVNSTALAVVGMAALFGGAARVPIATLVMVTEMTGGYGLIMPTMLAVAISFLVQYSLTRTFKYPSLYEAQVPTPAASPANSEVYNEIVSRFLRERRVRLDDEILHRHLKETLAAGAGIPLAYGQEKLYTIRLEPGTPVAGRQVRQTALPGVVIVGVLRGEKEIVPGADTVLLVGDELLVAATQETVARFKQRVAARRMQDTDGASGEPDSVVHLHAR